MNPEADDPLLESLLGEVLADEQPPDLSAQIMAALHKASDPTSSLDALETDPPEANALECLTDQAVSDDYGQTLPPAIRVSPRPARESVSRSGVQRALAAAKSNSRGERRISLRGWLAVGTAAVVLALAGYWNMRSDSGEGIAADDNVSTPQDGESSNPNLRQPSIDSDVTPSTGTNENLAVSGSQRTGSGVGRSAPRSLPLPGNGIRDEFVTGPQ